MSPITTCIFDAYGTLFDVNAAARSLAGAPGHDAFAKVWSQVSANWRTKQLQYTWLRAITGDHCDFWQVTQDALDWALDAAGHGNDGHLRAALLGLYWRLDAYPEVPKTLKALKENGIKTGIMSNESPEMLSAALNSAGIAADLDAVLSVEDVGIFKPASAVYDMVGARFGIDPRAVLFVSANGWDVASAAAYGFQTLWVNRADDPMDRLPGRPDTTARDLTGVAAMVGEPL